MSSSAAYIQVPPTICEAVPERAPRPTPSPALAERVSSKSRDHVSLGLPSIIDTPTITQLLESQEGSVPKPSVIAWDALSKCSGDARAKYKDLLVDFCRYMDMCDNTGFKAKGINVGSADNGLRTITGPLCNRWHPQRRAQWIAKMHQLADWYEANRIYGCTMISLTGYQEGLTIYETWDNINESRVKLLKILRKYIGKLDYFWVVEPHTENGSGYPHYHLVVFTEVDNNIRDSNGEGMEDKLRRLYSEEWQTGSHTYGLDFQVMKGDSSIQNLKNYLLKYISKGYINAKGWGQGELIFNAHLYGASHGYHPDHPKDDFTGEVDRKIYRLVGMSRNLSRILKPEETEREDIVWLHVDETEPIEIKNEKGEIVEDLDCVQIYDRLLIPDFIDTWRPIAKIQSWGSRIIDEKRRARALAFTDWDDS